MLKTEDARNVGKGSCGLQGRPAHGRTRSLCSGESKCSEEGDGCAHWSTEIEVVESAKRWAGAELKEWLARAAK
jgi:hypothetical protein